MVAYQNYPDEAGWKDETVSKDNAEAGRVRFTRMQKLVLDLYQSGFVGTADDAAVRLHLSPFSTRPRCTELLAKGYLERRCRDDTMPGRSAWVLQLASPPPIPEDLFSYPDRDGMGARLDGQPEEVQEWRDYDPDC